MAVDPVPRKGHRFKTLQRKIASPSRGSKSGHRSSSTYPISEPSSTSIPSPVTPRRAAPIQPHVGHVCPRPANQRVPDGSGERPGPHPADYTAASRSASDPHFAAVHRAPPRRTARSPSPHLVGGYALTGSISWQPTEADGS